jgi:tetratricopeptide (TPR) repeat protein
MHPMSKYLLAICFLAVPLTLAVPAQPQSPAKPAATPDYSKEAAVIELYSTKVAFENDGTGSRESTTRVRLQSDAGVQRFGLLVFSYQSSSETLDIDYVRVHKPDGTVVETPADNIQDMSTESSREAPMYSDQREKHVAVKGLGTGDVIEFQVHSRDSKPLVPGQFWYAYNFSHDGIVLQEKVQLSVPRDRAVKWKSPELMPVITEEAGRRVFTWSGSNLQSRTPEREKLDGERIQYQIARGLAPAPEIQLSSFQSWEEVGRWYGSLQNERVQPGPEVRAKSAELIKGAADEDAKIRAIYNYVSTQYRYIGIAFGPGRFQPHSAIDVLSNQYGDCKDKHTLLASLLQSIGITAYPALISSGTKLDPDVPSISPFNHVITAVPRGNSYLWLDTTSELAPLAYLLPQLRDKPALVIPGDRPPLFVTTPAEPPFPRTSLFKTGGTLSKAGVLDAHMEQSSRSDLELVFRTVFRRVPQSQWNNLVQQISSSSGFSGTVSGVVASSPEATDTPFHYSYDYTRKDYSDWENHRITPPFPPLLMPALRNDQTRFAWPLPLGSPGDSVLEANIKLPDGYTAQLPRAVDVKRDFAEYQASYESQKGVLIARRRLVVKLAEVPLAEFEEYKSFRKAIEDDQNQYIFLSDGSSSLAEAASALGNPAGNLPDSDNADAMRAESQARERTLVRDLPGTIEALKHAVKADPKFTRAWVMLGQYYMVSSKNELGVDAFHKAVDSNPQSPVPRQMLALALSTSGRSDDAIKALQDLLKMTPDDRGSAVLLGNILISQKRFAEAIPVLEAATKEHPKDGRLLLLLGSAYVRSGNQEMGKAAFAAALESEPGPGFKNDIGYELADAGVSLPDALQYAKDAVKEEEDASRTVHLDTLEASGLAHTPLLAAYWDTLGWVYFRMSDFPQAEKYLSSAWELSQDATIADHLGQVYEQEHQLQTAVRMYRLALAVNSSLPETQKRLDHLAPAKPKPASVGLGGRP